MKFTFPPESKPLDGYTIKRAIHRGGFGEVYYALSDAGKEVALKLLLQNTEIELRGVSQCMNLKHPNLVTIFDIRTDSDGDHWIVMEYVSGKNLARIIDERNGAMPIEEVQHWLSGISGGLSFLHDRGIVHRDLKPANLYMENGVVKIGDVGLAKFISESHRSAQTQSVGTVYYMAPEVAHGRYGREVDIYSLGIVLYELLTGRVPFDGESTAEILMKHLSEKPDLTPLPKRLRPVLARALEKDPMRRTPNVAQLEEDFRQAVLGFDMATDIPNESFQGTQERATSESKNPRNSSEAVRSHRSPQGKQSVAKHARGEQRKGAREMWKAVRKATRDARKKARKAARHARKLDKWTREPNRSVKGVPVQTVRQPEKSPEPDRSETSGDWLWKAAILIIVLVIFAPMTLPPLFTVGILGALGYGAYRFVVYLFDSDKNTKFVNQDAVPGQDAPAENHPEAAEPVFEKSLDGHVAAIHEAAFKAKQKVHAFKRKLKQRNLTPETLRSISMRHRLTELTGSLTFAALCTAIVTAGLSFSTTLLPEASHIGLFGGTTLLASWAILVLSKFCEGRETDAGLRRVTMLVLGGLVGAAAFWMQGTLLVEMPLPFNPYNDLNRHYSLFDHVGPHALLAGASQPALAGYVVFFAGLFALRRWWWHADSFRKKRFRSSSLLLTATVGFLITSVWSFPLVWGVTWAAAISSVVQVSAVWVPPEQRRRIVDGESHV